MHKKLAFVAVFGTAVFFNSVSWAREWTDATGMVKINGTLLSSDDKEVVIKLDQKRKEHELLAVPIESLSKADLEYLHSQEATELVKSADEKQVWDLANGMKVYGKLLRFVQKDVTLQRRRNKLYVNDRLFQNLPEVYQKMIPHIVAHFENRKFADGIAFDRWVHEQGAKARTFHCEGILLEFPNGDEYAVPLFFLTGNNLKLLEPAYQEWAAEEKQKQENEEYSERQRQQALYVQSQAAAMQHQQQEMLKIARLQLVMNSVTAGFTDLWEVYLYPPAGVAAYPMSVVVPARNSSDASAIALQRNPGYIVGPIRKVAGY